MSIHITRPKLKFSKSTWRLHRTKHGTARIENNKKAVIKDHFPEDEVKFRKGVESFLADAVGKDVFGLGKIDDYHIFTEGVASVVAQIRIKGGQTYIFKSCNDRTIGGDRKAQLEAEIFELRQKQGISVPHIYHKGNIVFDAITISYIIMEDIQPTTKFKDLDIKEVAYELGTVIAKMTRVKGTGFGGLERIKGNIPIGQYDTLDEYYTVLEDRCVKKLMDQNFIGEKEKLKTRHAMEIVRKEFDGGTSPTLSHSDIRIGNIFYTKPITVFDPDARLGHPLEDLAGIRFSTLMEKGIPAEEKPVRKEQLRKGYEDTTMSSVDDNIFNACMIIRIIRKVHARSENPKKKNKIKHALEILEQIKLR